VNAAAVIAFTFVSPITASKSHDTPFQLCCRLLCSLAIG